MMKLTRNEVPNTRKEFVQKFRTDYVFRSKAENMGFAVMGDTVIFPNGKVANGYVKQEYKGRTKSALSFC